MDKHTRESLWQLWTKTDYVEKNYPEVAKAYKKGWIADFADFVHKKYPGLEEEFVYESPYMGELSGDKPGKKAKRKTAKKKSGSKKKVSLGALTKTTKYSESDIVKEVAKESSVPQKTVKAVLDLYWSNIMSHIHDKHVVSIPLVGTFERKTRNYTDNLKKTGTHKIDSVKFTMTKAFKRECLGE